MELLQHIKSRLGAVKNVGKITRAMEVVSATKMRKAQEVALAARPYAINALELLRKLVLHAPGTIPLMEARKIKSTLVVIVASDRGLVGSFNAQVFRAADELLAGPNISVVTVGKKALQYAQKKNVKIVKSYIGHGDFVKYGETVLFADHIIEGFLSDRWDEVKTVSTHFRTTLKQETLIRQILPTDFEKIKNNVDEIMPERGRYADIKNKNGHLLLVISYQLIIWTNKSKSPRNSKRLWRPLKT